MFQHKNVEDIEKVLNNDFENIRNWFVDKKLSIHFWEGKTNEYFLSVNVKANIYI